MGRKIHPEVSLGINAGFRQVLPSGGVRRAADRRRGQGAGAAVASAWVRAGAGDGAVSVWTNNWN